MMKCKGNNPNQIGGLKLLGQLYPGSKEPKKNRNTAQSLVFVLTVRAVVLCKKTFFLLPANKPDMELW